MYLYRAKEIGNRNRLKKICLKIIERGDYDQILEILPHIRILRSLDFYGPLLNLLKEGRCDQQTAAALALGSLGDSRCISDLCDTYSQACESEKYGSQNLKSSVIEALGELATKDAVPALIDLVAKSDEKSQNLDELESMISALGQLSQQGIEGAEEQLIDLMNKTDNPVVISLSITEILVAYWHRPSEISDDLFEQIIGTAANGPKEVVRAAVTSLSSLIQLGSDRARVCLAKIEDSSVR